MDILDNTYKSEWLNAVLTCEPGYTIVNGACVPPSDPVCQPGYEWNGTQCVAVVSTSPPIISTTSASSITNNSATLGGTIINNGGSAIISSGICWATTTTTPTILYTKTVGTAVSGTFTSNMTALVVNKIYYVRAYATNAIGTGYGSTVTFTTLATPPCGTASYPSEIFPPLSGTPCDVALLNDPHRCPTATNATGILNASGANTSKNQPVFRNAGGAGLAFFTQLFAVGSQIASIFSSREKAKADMAQAELEAEIAAQKRRTTTNIIIGAIALTAFGVATFVTVRYIKNRK